MIMRMVAMAMITNAANGRVTARTTVHVLPARDAIAGVEAVTSGGQDRN